MSLRKYHGEIGGPQHNNAQLNWPGTLDGFPVIGNGNRPDLKQEELENIDIQYDFKSRMFELWDTAQKAEFDNINDKIVNGWYRLLKRSDNWDDENKHFRVWLEWAQVYGMIPPKH
ncbi:hypothetical protein EBZ39_02440 [bacterium]|nr:hypothetical protein [bacterium]